MEHSTIHVDQDGLYVKVRRGSGTVRLRQWGAGVDELVGELPKHPSEGHKKANGEPTCVLPSTVAAAVLTDLELPNIRTGVLFTSGARSL